MCERANRLIHETSPYLLQHAYNPVDWFPWGPEALEKARRENKPILLSVGYSACHWCHVMERESFENEQIAELMNRYFVNIKVDREERPDLDHIYQLAAQVLTGQGGWPLTVFLTPDQRPFYAGTYFPPDDRYGRPGFPKILQALHEVIQEDPQRVEEAAGQLMDALRQVHRSGRPGEDVPGPSVLERAGQRLLDDADTRNGGFGDAPKFPSAFALAFLLRYERHTGDEVALKHVLHSLRKMAEGGLYDQLGGGFHRYTVDAAWRVPHFEKMLYDNAVLPPLYLEAYSVSGDPLFARIVRETLAYVEREMSHPDGGFYSTQDADSEGVEGKFFVWTPSEVGALFEPEQAVIVCDYYGITEQGNFEEGTTVLQAAASAKELASRHGWPVARVEQLLAEARDVMFEEREKRVRPFRDEKVLTGWNALMISAFARAAQVLGDASYLQRARRAIAFIDRYLAVSPGEPVPATENGVGEAIEQAGGSDVVTAASAASASMFMPKRLLRSYKDRPGSIPGYLEDYVFLAQAFIDLYETDFDPSDLRRAEALMETALNLFWDEEEGGLFLTPDDHEPLIERPKEAWDQSVPSGNGVAAQVLLRLYSFSGEERWRNKAEAIFRLFGSRMAQNPFGFGSLLQALARYHGVVKEIVVAAGPEASAAEELLSQIHRMYIPERALARSDGQEEYPLLAAGKSPGEGGEVAVYVCQDFHCERPVHTWDELVPLLE